MRHTGTRATRCRDTQSPRMRPRYWAGRYSGILFGWPDFHQFEPTDKLAAATRRAATSCVKRFAKPNRIPSGSDEQAKTRDLLSISLDRNSVLRLPIRREPTRSLHNLLHRQRNLRDVTAGASGVPDSLWRPFRCRGRLGKRTPTSVREPRLCLVSVHSNHECHAGVIRPPPGR